MTSCARCLITEHNGLGMLAQYGLTTLTIDAPLAIQYH
jgi:hypothetical protein